MASRSTLTCSDTTRRQWKIRGQVQGVGFRPFVYRLAMCHGLSGFVRNDGHGVTIEAQGAAVDIERFTLALKAEQPTLVRFRTAVVCDIPPHGRWDSFAILDSQGSTDTHRHDAQITVDTATCNDCLAELLDPTDRRFGYGLINCTNCGPRYSIVRRVPYDRLNTTMAPFGMCAACEGEYRDASDRRFHAQPIACHGCGPVVQLVDPHGRMISSHEPIRETMARLQQGQIIAIKGLGGFHLSVRADDQEAVAKLRRLKQRDAKPFAVICGSLDQAQQLVQLSDRAAEAMASPAGPIVLARRQPETPVADDVAPQNHRLGVMLPSTPIHHLMFADQRHKLGPLVMTSANISDEPIVVDNHEALDRLGSVCDAMLWHDRLIERCVDDSVLLDMGPYEPLPIRRSRGYAPGTFSLPVAGGGDGLCVGGELKCTVAAVQDGQAVLSQHLGNLTHPLSFAYFKKATTQLNDLFGVEPRWIAHDLHPAYLSTGYARQLATKQGVPLISVQHHHAHAASLMAEHGITGPVLAVVCDGVGYGGDGTAWGGELMVADLVGFRRLARLRPMTLPGGDIAATDIRRCGLALLYQALGDGFDCHAAAKRLVAEPSERSMLTVMIKRGVSCVHCSSAGRLFDGIAALLGVCYHNSFESQAATALESCADRTKIDSTDGELLFVVHHRGEGIQEIDLSPFVRQILVWRAQGQHTADIAWAFHDQLAAAWETVVTTAARQTGIRCVGLTGGVFCNELLARLLSGRLTGKGMTVLQHRMVPPNDGGLSLGQAAVAAARLGDKRSTRMEDQPCV